MARTLQQVCMLYLVLCGTLGRASPHSERRAAAASVNIAVIFPGDDARDSHTSKDSSDTWVKNKRDVGGKVKACKTFNITQSQPELQEIKVVPKRFFTIFVRPQPSFKKLMFKLHLQNLFSWYGVNSKEDITLLRRDLRQDQWTRVQVEHYKHVRLGFDRHALRVIFDNKTLSETSRKTWRMNIFNGVAVFAEGEAQILFDCHPNDLDKPFEEEYVSYSSTWVMGGLLVVAVLLLAVLCAAWVYLECNTKRKQTSVSQAKCPVYEEFDEEVLEIIRQKAAALQSGKSQDNLDTVFVTYKSPKENHYVLENPHHDSAEDGNHNDHHYEDIDKNSKNLCCEDYTYQNLANENVCVGDHLYESLPYIEEYLEKRGDANAAFPSYERKQ